MSQRDTVAIIAGQLVVGGAERQLYLWLAHLDRDRFQPVVVTLHPGHNDYWEGPIETLGIQLLRVPSNGNSIARLLEISRILRPFRPHLIHGWHLFACPYSGAAAKLLGARASLGSLRSSYASYHRQQVSSRLTERLVDGILVNSHVTEEQLVRAKRWPRKKIHVVQNAVDDRIEERALARSRLCEQWKIPEASVWIGTVGRFNASKRFDLMLDLAKYLNECGENFHLLIIGYGGMAGILRERANALQIEDRVTFIGSDPDARQWLSALDIFCFLSTDEGLPNAVMEAAVARVPVIAWRMPFMQELLDNDRSAILVDPNDFSGFCNKVLTLIREPALRSRLGKAGQDVMLDRFSVDRAVRSLTSVYDELLSNQV
jgi:glycosyltransferase involved in cell wall biosynthesis